MLSTSARFVLGLTAAGVVVAGGSAYSDSVTFTPGDDEIVGYGTADVDGATVRNIAYNTDPADSSLLTDLTFTLVGNFVDAVNPERTHDIKLALSGTTTPIDCPNGNRTFVPVANTPGTTTVRCDTTAAVLSVTSVHLTVTPS